MDNTQNTGGAFAGVTTEAFTKYVESSYTWTNPPRWFKANDPYWYQLDNLPLKQIHENCQWLKDQIEFTLGSSGVGRSDFNELRPFVVGGDRRLRVLPGNFIGRVNDAYNKGVATADEHGYMRFISYILDQNLPDNPNGRGVTVQEENYQISLRDQVFATLIGYDISPSSSFPANGLYDSLQFHESKDYYVLDLSQPNRERRGSNWRGSLSKDWGYGSGNQQISENLYSIYNKML